MRESVACWRDLATGDPVTVRVHPLVGDWTTLERALLEESVAGSGAPPLVDFGPVGCGAWFEARAASSWGDEPRDEASRRIAEQVATLAAGTHRGVRFVRVPARERRAKAAAAATARRLRSLGFVTLRPGVPIGVRVAEALAHRHVALVLCSASDRSQVTNWVRRLARVSPRSHLIADLAHDGPPTSHPSTLRERAAVDAGPSVPVGHWLGGSGGLDVVGADDVATTARDALMQGNLAAAESALAGAVALAGSHRTRTTPDVTLLQAELRFWQGRFTEAAVLCAEVGADVLESSVPADVLRGLIAWARADADEIHQRRTALATQPSSLRAAAEWEGALAALAAALSRDESAVRQAVTRCAPQSGAADVPALARAACAEALGCCGDVEGARRVLAWPDAWAGVSPLYRLLAEWLGARLDGGAGAAVTARVNRAGAHGVRRWGSRTVHLLQALPTMLQLVHDAEDEMAALSSSCAWVRRHFGARGVAFLSTDGRVITGDGWCAAGVEAQLGEVLNATAPRTVIEREGVLAAAPVRYAGRMIGSVAARGPADVSGTLTEAVATLAALAAPALRARLDALVAARDSQTAMPEIIGRSPAIIALRDAIARAAAAPFPILVEGESGTGKELVARAVHRLSPRRDRRFSAVNCAALGDELIEAELFGHARGAFTGAIGPRAGLFEDAHGGTLMLDEVAELSARAQAKLLRVLQEREVRRLGENAPRPVDVRIVAATNRPLGELAGRGLFRADLLFRLAVIRLRLPPLRERVEDVPVLVHALWRELTRQAGKRALLGPDAVAALCRHGWPGNVRELQNVVAALVVEAPARGRTSARAVAQVLDASNAERDSAVVPLGRARTCCERQVIASALARHAGRRAPAARELGLTRQGLAKAMKRLGLFTPGDHAGVA